MMLLIVAANAFSQNSACLLKVANIEKAKQIENNGGILLNGKFYELVPSYPGAKTPELLLYFDAVLEDDNQVNILQSKLKTVSDIVFEKSYEKARILTCENPVPYNDAEVLGAHINFWVYEQTNLQCAWSVTTGNPDIVIAICDTDFDVNHEDLRNQFVSPVWGPVSENHPHGTMVAGVAGAEVNNGKGICGVGYNCKLAGYRFRTVNGEAESGNTVKNAIWQAYLDGRPVINVSVNVTGLEYMAAEEITEYGSTLVLGAGNRVGTSWHGDIANIPGVIAVSGISGASGVSDGWYINEYERAPWVDLCAPAIHVPVTRPNNRYWLWESGTSMAAPFVSGTVALMLSINPNLTPAEIETIIKNTTKPITNANLYPDSVGTGCLDIYAAVLETQRRILPPSPLLIRDDKHDNGTEPNPRSITWNSPDIKLVNEYDEPILTSQLHNYSTCSIVVTVQNIGNTTSRAEKLHVYWSKLGLGSRWPVSWTNGQTGGEITKPERGVTIPPLPPQGSTPIYVKWNLPDYFQEQNAVVNQHFRANIRVNWGIALLARVDYGNETYGFNNIRVSTETFARRNSNVAISNGNMLLFAEDYGMLMHLERPSNMGFSVGYNQLLKEDQYILNDFAEVYSLLSNDLIGYVDWERSRDIKRVDENRVFLTSVNSELVFNPLENEDGAYFIGAEVNFISDKMPELNDFDFDLTYNVDGEEPETMRFTAIRDADVYFKAQAEASKTKVVKAKEEVTLTSNIIYEDAKYTWYDEAGNVIGDGYQITIIPDFSQKYKIEIKQDKDGFKAYDEVMVIVVDGVIKHLAPNPAKDYVIVYYLLSDNATNVSVQVSNLFNNVSVSYPLSTTEEELNIPLSGLVSGNYVVKLIVSGVVVDVQSLIIY